MQIELFTDGAASGNPGPGGYAAILRCGTYEKELSEGFRRTTNNRMELLAVIKGLEALNKLNSHVVIYSDSKYVINSVEKKWVFRWQKTDYKGKKNADLWQRFLVLYQQHQVSFIWVRGHSGHPENQRCDELAVRARSSFPLLVDTNFEQTEKLLGI